MHRYTYADLVQLSRDDPAVYHVVRRIENGEITREEGLCTLVVLLVTTRDQLRDQLLDCVARQPRTYILERPE